MQRAGIIANRHKGGVSDYIESLIGLLKAHACTPMLEAGFAGEFGAAGYNKKDIFALSDFLIVLGGDGTILNAAAGASANGVPVLGINFGTMGFLTDAEAPDGLAAVENVLKGNYKTENRMTLNAYIPGKTDCEIPHALNEFCVTKGVLSRMITFDVILNDSYINTYRADGIIAATPTGSTAYNLSAGGPVLKPDGDMIALTPICPHDLFARPSVISGRDVIKIKIVSGGENDIVLSADGKLITNMEHDDCVLIRASEHCMKIIKTNDLSFFDILRKKMSD